MQQRAEDERAQKKAREEEIKAEKQRRNALEKLEREICILERKKRIAAAEEKREQKRELKREQKREHERKQHERKPLKQVPRDAAKTRGCLGEIFDPHHSEKGPGCVFDQNGPANIEMPSVFKAPLQLALVLILALLLFPLFKVSSKYARAHFGLQLQGLEL